MIEAHDIAQRHQYHVHKLILIFSAMRHYRDNLRARGFTVHYVSLRKDSVFLRELEAVCRKNDISALSAMKPSDMPAEKALQKFSKSANISLRFSENKQFLTSEEDFKNWLGDRRQPRMENFYHWQRKKLNILMNDDSPEGGKWNFDAQNRKPLPKKGIEVPKLPKHTIDETVHEVGLQVSELFADNPGSTDTFWLPVTRSAALEWLESFIAQRFDAFGDYEDAMEAQQPFLFHSVLSPLINCGLLTPHEVIERALRAYYEDNVPLNAVEGFIRQIIGWREYMYGIYRNKTEMITENYFGFSKELEDWWYTDEWQNKDLPSPVKEVL